MASGHVNRTAGRTHGCTDPSLRREESPCQLGAVHAWHIRDIPRSRMDFRFRWKSSLAADITSMTEFDPSEASAARICCDAQRGISYCIVVGCKPRVARST